MIEPKWWAASIQRRATVEQWMFDAARGKRPMPTPEELHAWALKLGTPGEGEPGLPPINMVLYCPFCGIKHIDGPEAHFHDKGDGIKTWGNPPHKSHLCHGCGCIWRPADVPTNGVASTATRGKNDTWPVSQKEPAA